MPRHLPGKIAYWAISVLAVMATLTFMVCNPSYRRAQLRSTESLVGRVRDAAEKYAALGRPGCPTIHLLVEARLLERDAPLVDAWGNALLISCDADGVTVRSLGQDGEPNTADDVVRR